MKTIKWRYDGSRGKLSENMRERHHRRLYCPSRHLQILCGSSGHLPQANFARAHSTGFEPCRSLDELPADTLRDACECPDLSPEPFRVIEYLNGNDGHLLSSELFLYIFDALLMLSCLFR